MAVDAARAAFLNAENLDEYYLVGFGEDTTGGLTGTVIEVTSLAGAATTPGTWAWALAVIAATPSSTGNVYVIINTSGTLNRTSVSYINRPNVTIDALGQYVRFTGRGISFGPLANNIVVLNIHIEDVGSGDGISLESGNTNFFIAHYESGPGTIIDGHLDITRAKASGQRGTVAWYRSRQGTTAALTMIQGDRGTGLTNSDSFITGHHCFHDGTRQRHPLTRGKWHSFNNYIKWGTLAGIEIQRHTDYDDGVGDPAEVWSENDTFDAAVSGTGGSPPTNQRGMYYYHAGARGKVTGARLLNTAQANQQNAGSVTDFHAMYAADFTVHATSAAHDLVVQRRAGNRLRVTMGGTMNGNPADDMVGTTVLLDFSANDPLPAAGTAFNAVRQTIIDGFRMVGDPTFDGGDVFTSVSDIVRTSSTRVTCTVSGSLALEADGELYWEGAPTGTWLVAWNPQTILAAGETPPDPPPDAPIVSVESDATSTDATSFTTGSVTVDAAKYYIMTVVTSRVPINEIPTVTGWTQLYNKVNAVGNRQLTLLGAHGSDISTGTFTIDYNSETQAGCAWDIAECEGLVEDSEVTANIAEAEEATHDILVSLGAFAKPANRAFAAFMHEDDTEGVPGSGFTLLTTTFFTPQIAGLMTAWHEGEANQVTATWPDGSHSGEPSTLGVALELNVAEAPAGADPGTPVLLTSGADDTDATSYTTASVAPTAGRLVCVVVHAMATANPVPEIRDANSTVFTADANATVLQTSGVDHRISLHWAPADSLVEGVLTIDFDTFTPSSCTWHVFEIPDCDLVTPIKQVKTAASVSAGTTAGVTFDAAFDPATNLTLLIVGTRQATTGDFTPDGSLTLLEDTHTTLTPGALATMYLEGEDASPSCTIAASRDWTAVGIEIAGTAGGGVENPVVEVTAPTLDEVLEAVAFTAEWTVEDSGGSPLTQVSYRVRVFEQDGGALVFDTGVMTSASLSHALDANWGGEDAGLYELQVTVVDENGGTASSAVQPFSIDVPAPSADPPTITSIDPTSGDERGGTEVVITGTDFVDGATVSFGDSLADQVTFDSATQLTVVTSAGAPGLVTVTVTNPDLQSDTLVDAYEYIVVPNEEVLPLVTSPRHPSHPSIPEHPTTNAE